MGCFFLFNQFSQFVRLRYSELFSSKGIKSKLAAKESGLEKYGWGGYILDLSENPKDIPTINKLKAIDCLAWLEHKAMINNYNSKLRD